MSATRTGTRNGIAIGIGSADPGTSATAEGAPMDDRRPLDVGAPRRAARATDVRSGQGDRLVRHVAERLRRGGVELPDAELLHLCEVVVADVTRVALAWAEEPLSGTSRRR